ncbi:MAG: bifunctional phosphoserine phosphatase/homoserine phosphotransferase ThrH [Calditrichaeota bacterium]|nr:MAG: bifunctional phosphoserine phosphatase/homoserine phosphotransferase ThrH [Calditrichota bacterium]
MLVACLDLEGVLTPEIWIQFAAATGIEELRLTTRDVPDYDQLMRRRLRILEEHHLGLPDIQKVIAGIAPLPGALDMIDWIRERWQLLILSDTFYEFASPLMKQLNWPTLLCHSLKSDESGRVIDYLLRQKEGKRRCVEAMHLLNFQVIAVGDSYNDTAMLTAADVGILFRPPQHVAVEFPQFAVTTDYEELKAAMLRAEQKIVNKAGN